MARDLFTECAEQLAATPDLVTQLLAEHVANADGWCRSHNAHPERHPCSIRRLAELAGSRDESSPSAVAPFATGVTGRAYRSS